MRQNTLRGKMPCGWLQGTLQMRFRDTLRVRAVLLMKLLVSGMLAVMAAGMPVEGAPLGGETPPPRAQEGQWIDFEECVRIALERSPHLLKSALEVEVRHLDEADSRSSIVPSLFFETTYYVSRPEEEDHDRRRATIAFTTGSYNPVESYFSSKARGLVAEIAVLNHLRLIDDELYSMARKLIEAQALDETIALQEEMGALAAKYRLYAQTRNSSGAASDLETQVAEQEWKVLQAETARMIELRTSIEDEIRFLLALSSDDARRIDPGAAREQAIGHFDPSVATLEKCREHCFALKIQKIRIALQQWNIKLAFTKYVPTLSFGLQSPDALNLAKDSDLHVALGIRMRLWDGWERKRDVSRQRLVMKQYESDERATDKELERQWKAARRHLKSVSSALDLSISAEKLARLKEQLSQARYESGEEPLSALVQNQRSRVQAQKAVVSAARDRDLAVLLLRYLSGDLFITYVHVAPFRE
ncbi:TolC family protein [Thermodesulfobacteriota bacterium]